MRRPRFPLRLLVDKDVPTLAGATQLGARVVARRGHSLVFLSASEIWAFEAAGAKTFIHGADGRFELNLGLAEIESTFCRPLLRVHRNWLVDAAQVRALDPGLGHGGGDWEAGQTATLFVGIGLGESGAGIRVPIGRDYSRSVRDALLAGGVGLRAVRLATAPDACEESAS